MLGVFTLQFMPLNKRTFETTSYLHYNSKNVAFLTAVDTMNVNKTKVDGDLSTITLARST